MVGELVAYLNSKSFAKVIFWNMSLKFPAIVISLIGYFKYNQVLDGPGILGMTFIVIGIIILRFYSKSINI